MSIGAGDSIDLINYFFQTIHKELNFNTEEDILSRYLVNNNIENNKKFQNLNFTISNFTSSNKSIITNTFYIIEKSKIHCNACNQVQYSFQFLSFIIFPLEDIRIYNFNKTGINQNSVTLTDGFEYYKRFSFKLFSPFISFILLTSLLLLYFSSISSQKAVSPAPQSSPILILINPFSPFDLP